MENNIYYFETIQNYIKTFKGQVHQVKLIEWADYKGNLLDAFLNLFDLSISVSLRLPHQRRSEGEARGIMTDNTWEEILI